jgi:hypothetical protein
LLPSPSVTVSTWPLAVKVVVVAFASSAVPSAVLT